MQLRKKRKVHILTMILLLVLMLTNGCSLFPEEEEALTPPLIVPREITYRTEEARVGYIENVVTCLGYLVPVKSEDLIFRNTSGRLKKIHVSVGDTVKKGDLIAELITDNLENDIKQQELTLKSKKESYLYSQQVAEIDLEEAYEKLRELVESYDELIRNGKSETSAEVEKVLKDIDNQKTIVKKMELSTRNQLEAKLIDIESTQMRLDTLYNQLENSRLVAPMDGIITYITNAREGNNVDAFATIARIADLDELQLEYRGMEAGKFKLGMKVNVEFGDKIEVGEVVLTPSSVPVSDADRYRDTIRVKLDRIPEGLKNGDSGRIKLLLEKSENAVLIPRNALRMYSGKYLVYILEDGLRVERYVKKGIESGSLVEIIEGINPGEQVIVE